VLALVTLVAVLGFALSTLSLSRLSLGSSVEVQRQAEEAARSLMQVVLAKTAENFRNQDDEIVEAGRARARVVFRRVKGDALPLSVNNLEAPDAKVAPEGVFTEDNRFVPVGTVRLMIESKCQKYTARYEALLHSPGLPYAIASCGRIRSRGSLVVACMRAIGVEKFKELRKKPFDLGLPADITSNSPSDEAIEVSGGPVDILGDLRCCGKARLSAADLRVAGEVREAAPPCALPVLKTTDQYQPTGQSLKWGERPPAADNDDNETEADYVMDIEADELEDLKQVQNCRHHGNLLVKNVLRLQGNRLYVSGNLDVKGQVRGFGTIVVGGRMDFPGQYQEIDNPPRSQVSSDRLLIFTHGGVKLAGQGMEKSFFHGLIMSNGLIEVSQVSLVGSLVALGKQTTDLRVDLNDCLFVQDHLVPAVDVMHVLDKDGGDFRAPGQLRVDKAAINRLKFTWTGADKVQHPYDLLVREPKGGFSPQEKADIEAAGQQISPGNAAPYVESDDRYRSFGGWDDNGEGRGWHWVFNHMRWIYHQKEALEELAPATLLNPNERLRPAFFRKVS